MLVFIRVTLASTLQLARSGVQCSKRVVEWFQATGSEPKANGMALMVALFTITFLQLESPSRPAGADPTRVIASKSSPVIIEIREVPVPAATSNEQTEQLSPEQLADKSVLEKIDFLEKGIQFLKTKPDYIAQFAKREMVGDALLDEQTMVMKVRHQPFGVYLKWIDFEPGREVLFSTGQYDDKLVVHGGGWKARLPAMTVPVDGTLAMAEARYPITKAGLLNLAVTIRDYNRDDMERKSYAKCLRAADQKAGERDCFCFVMEYKSAATSPDYRKSVTLLDKEWYVPLYIKNFGWPCGDAPATEPELDEATLLEEYTYLDVKFGADLKTADFDRTNSDYNFKRQ